VRRIHAEFLLDRNTTEHEFFKETSGRSFLSDLTGVAFKAPVDAEATTTLKNLSMR
jgi:hypothetical protein